ncbi:tRNA dimethylallyltransferase 9 isoform X2 [Mercurialis annua]|uniref:tRNA dimethylallyltransferase 9 isoform X2 n=1 Tax=Mercurialis annua TaxID=3986 RepID=UPI00215DD860|nr:tRNA dimethylallyltransferase 9 isoform X2 [Mercurialis annua]
MIMSEVCGLRTRCLRCLLPSSSPLLRRRSCLFSTSTIACSAAASRKEKVVVISGPTGAGKSRLAMELAKRLNGEIISADSVQVYRGLDVGSAKPTPSERKEVPHHLIDILHPSEDYSVGRFFEDARHTTQNILDRGRVPIVAGGTGLYLRWFVYGKPDVPKASPEIASESYSELAELQENQDWDAAVQLVVNAGDPKAEFLPANDWYRLRRSLEIIKATGSPPSSFQVPYDSFKEQSATRLTESSLNANVVGDVYEKAKPKDLDYEFLCFFLSSPRIDLYRSIDYRCEDMLSGTDGILSEAKWLLDMGLLPKSNSPTRAIGYRQAMEYILQFRQQGGSSTGEFYAFLSEFQKASRNFAKRQMTWFRNEHIYHWVDASKPLDKVLNFIYDAYHDQTGSLVVPESLRMDKSNQQENRQLKTYRTKNRHFVSRNDCSDILDWLRTQETVTGSMV